MMRSKKSSSFDPNRLLQGVEDAWSRRSRKSQFGLFELQTLVEKLLQLVCVFDVARTRIVVKATVDMEARSAWHCAAKAEE